MLEAYLESQRLRLVAALQKRLGPPPHPVGVDAEEIVNETLFRAHGHDGQSPGPAPELPSYTRLYRIALDVMIEAWRKAHAQCRDPDLEVPWPERSSIELGLGLVESGTTPSGALARIELQEQVQGAMNGLKPDDREILWLRHFDNFRFADVGEVLGITEDAATARYWRAIKRLRTAWNRLESLGRAGGLS